MAKKSSKKKSGARKLTKDQLKKVRGGLRTCGDPKNGGPTSRCYKATCGFTSLCAGDKHTTVGQ